MSAAQKQQITEILATMKIGAHLAIDGTIDYTKDDWNLQIFRHHPDFVGPDKFPDTFIEYFYTIFKMCRDGVPIVTPDGKSISDWRANLRPSLIGDGMSPKLLDGGHSISERELYELFEGWVKNHLLLSYGPWDGGEDNLDKKADWVYNTFILQTVRGAHNDEQLLRFQQEYWRKAIYELMPDKISIKSDSDKESENEHKHPQRCLRIEGLTE